MQEAHKDAGGTWNYTKQLTIANCNRMITWCENQMKHCKDKAKEEKTGKAKSYKYELENMNYLDAMESVATKANFSGNERFVYKIFMGHGPLEPTMVDNWDMTKSMVSTFVKSIKAALTYLLPGNKLSDPNVQRSGARVVTLIDELIRRLTDLQNEDVPAEPKRFILGMVNSLFTQIPTDEIVISRFDSDVSSADLPWFDVLVNIKTNLSSLKDWAANKACPKTAEQTDTTDLGGNMLNTFDQITKTDNLNTLIIKKYNRVINHGIGGRVFEAIMLGNLSHCDRTVMESGMSISSEQVENAALIETILDYTVFETLDSIGLYKFRMGDMDKVKSDFMRCVTEDLNPLSTDSSVDNGGRKKIRINTKLLKTKSSAPLSGDQDIAISTGENM
jgi:hypothetical protein